MAEKDLSRIIDLIMANPNLIKEIQALAENGEGDGKEKEPVQEIPAVSPEKTQSRSKRRELLCALKPYLSEERCRAVDQMLSISDILEMMRKK